VESLKEVLADPIITKTEDVHEKAMQVVANQLTSSGSHHEHRDRRYLFDLIVNLARALSEQEESAQPIELAWQLVVDVRTEPLEHCQKTYFVDKGAEVNKSTVYLIVERHIFEIGPYFVISWPTRQDVERLFNYVSYAYHRHLIAEVRLFVGLQNDILRYKAELPITYRELMQDHRIAGKTVHWIRFESEAFDLYFDVPTKITQSAHVGIIVRNPNLEHLVDCYMSTASRFLFRRWLELAFESQGIN
jgi:hypothetical protein